MVVGEAWAEALRDLRIAHTNPGVPVVVTIVGDSLTVACPGTLDTVTGLPLPNFVVSSVSLTYFPGPALARAWLAAAWAGYCQHEALENVTVQGQRPLDPHLPPYTYDRGLRQGFPVILTPDTLRGTFEAIMSPGAADTLLKEHGWTKE